VLQLSCAYLGNARVFSFFFFFFFFLARRKIQYDAFESPSVREEPSRSGLKEGPGTRTEHPFVFG